MKQTEAKAPDGASPRVMLQVAQPDNVEPRFAAVTAAGVRGFGHIGVSYYSKCSTFNMGQAGTALAKVKQRFKADIIVVEVSYPWALRDAGDKASNLLGEDSLLRGYPATPSGQQRLMNDRAQDPEGRRSGCRLLGTGLGFHEPRHAPGNGIALGERDAVRFPQGKRAGVGRGFSQGHSG